MTSITYDVDQFVTDVSFLSRFVDHLGLHCTASFDQFLEPEKVLFGVADFECMTGNGLAPLVENENFDTISRATWSLQHFPSTRAASAMQELDELLCSFGFPKNPDERTEFLGAMRMNEAETERFDAELAALDRKYYGGGYANTLWASRELNDAARAYLIANLEELRTRKAT